MQGYPEIRIIINPDGVEKAQLIAVDEKGQKAGLELYQKLCREINTFSKQVWKTLKREIRSVE